MGILISTIYESSLKRQLELLNQADGCSDAINTPTRITVIKSGVVICDIGDHLATFVCIHKCASKQVPRKCDGFQLITSDRLDAFYAEFSDTDWNEVIGKTSPGKAFDILIDKFKRLYEKYLPYRTIGGNKKPRKPWITTKSLGKSRMKNFLYKTFVKTKNPDKLRIFKS